jgi:hypothetical protein
VVLLKVQGGIGPEAFSGLDFIKEAIQADGGLRLTVEDAPRHLKALLDRCPAVEEVQVRRVTLDDVFLKFTGRQIRDEEGEGSIFQRIAATGRR